MSKKYFYTLIVIMMIMFTMVTTWAVYITQQTKVVKKENQVTQVSENKDSIQYEIIYLESNNNYDISIIWRADVPYFINKQSLTTIEHAPGFPINASLSPDGTKVAYTNLPRGAGLTRPYLNGELWVFDIPSKKHARLTKGIDYQIIPTWSPDSSGVVYQRYSEQEGMQLSFIGVNGERNIVLASYSHSTLHPIGFSRDGKKFYYYRVSSEGNNEVWEVGISPVTPPRSIITINKGAVHSLKLSPSGKLVVVSFSEMEDSFSEKILLFSLYGKEGKVVEQGAKKAYTPIWGPLSENITYNIPYYEYPTTSLNYRYGGELIILNLLTQEKISLAQSTEWMDVPISWSPNGEWLAFRRYPEDIKTRIRNYEGSYNEPLPSPNYTEFVGWLSKTKRGEK